MTALRYLAFVPDRTLDVDAWTRRVEFSTGLSSLPNSTPTLLFRNADTPVIEGPHRLIIGTLFDKTTNARATLADVPAAPLKSSELFSRFWGGYVSIAHGAAGLHVLRDPSGALPCYHFRSAHGQAFASDPQLLCDAGLMMPEIDFGSLAIHLRSAGMPGPRTVLRGLEEVAPGFELETVTGSLSSVWNPWDFVSESTALQSEPVEERLRRTVQNCVGAWAAGRHQGLIGISGGLDSSIVASCLARTRTPVLAATLATEDPEGDERPFARMLARSLKIPLIEAAYRHQDVDLTKSAAAHLPRPTSRSPLMAHDATMLRIARKHGVDAFFTGIGGDNVFCLIQSVKVLLDRCRSRDEETTMGRVLLDFCRLTDVTPMRAVWLTACRLWSDDGKYRWAADESLLHRDAVAIAAPLEHPWLNGPRKALPGKAAHIAMLLRAQQTLEGFDRAEGLISINPLVSQPVMELCLSIPSWHWCTEGRNRSVARRAFANELPSRIVNRRHKGGPDGFSIEVLERNRSVIADRLLDGILAKEKLIDRGAVEVALSDRGPTLGLERVRILSLLDTEAWLEHWSEKRKIALPTAPD